MIRLFRLYFLPCNPKTVRLNALGLYVDIFYLTNSELFSGQDLQEGSLCLNGNKGVDYH